MEDKHTGYTLVRMLMAYGAEVIFGVPGGQTLPLYDATYAHPNEIKHVMMRDERHAGHAACAYSRISGKVGMSSGGSPTGCVRPMWSPAGAARNSPCSLRVSGGAASSNSSGSASAHSYVRSRSPRRRRHFR